MTGLDDLTPGTWTIDPSHTSLGFVARHLVVAKVRGRFGAVTGAITIAPDHLASSVAAEIEMASVDTGDRSRRAPAQRRLLRHRAIPHHDLRQHRRRSQGIRLRRNR